MKKYFISAFMALTAFVSFTACDDVMETDPDNILLEDDYISKESEMYRGFLGIVTRMQEVGDQAIFLTDPRCNYLETTGNAPVALQNINNYAATDGNEYADPTGYYAVISACNNFVSEMDDFYYKVNGALSDSAKVHIPRMISCATRIKAWSYYMLGRIYGEAYWYDEDLDGITSLNDASVFTHLDMKGICDKCIEVLDGGVQACGRTVPADLTMDWTRWVNPVNGNDNYQFWAYMTPAWLPLRAELTAWRTNYENDAAAKTDWQWVQKNVLQFLSDAISANGSDYYSCSMQIILEYPYLFWAEQVSYPQQILSGIFYDYENKQYNRLVQYFCPEWPGDGYYLRPSDYSATLYNESDIRGPKQLLVNNVLGDQPCFTKYYYTRLNNQGYLRDKIFEIEPAIPLFRGHDLHFLLAEAENHLGHPEVASTLLNMGLLNTYPGGETTLPTDSLDGTPIWDENYKVWFASSGGYGDIGIVGANRAKEHELSTYEDWVAANPSATEADWRWSKDRMKEYDLALADEYLKEFTGEGKAYSYLVKMAERYNGDYRIIYDRVAGKYDASHAATVQSSLAEKYFIDWNLKVGE